MNISCGFNERQSVTSYVHRSVMMALSDWFNSCNRKYSGTVIILQRRVLTILNIFSASLCVADSLVGLGLCWTYLYGYQSYHSATKIYYFVES